MKKYLIIGGLSGTGKTVLRDNLLEQYPEIFKIAPQVTTRKLREEESIYNYCFVDNRVYDILKPILIGKCTINGERYGTINIPSSDIRTMILILNEEGIKDFIKEMNKEEAFILILDKELEFIEVRRENRDDSYLNKEREIVKYADTVYSLSDSYADPQTVVDIMLLDK